MNKRSVRVFKKLVNEAVTAVQSVAATPIQPPTCAAAAKGVTSAGGLTALSMAIIDDIAEGRISSKDAQAMLGGVRSVIGIAKFVRTYGNSTTGLNGPRDLALASN